MTTQRLRLPLLLLTALLMLAADAQAQPARADEPIPDSTLVTSALHELSLSLDAYFELIDNEDLLLFVEAVRHAARGRLLLEQYLGDDIDSVSLVEDDDSQIRFSLVWIARRAADFSGEEAREMWRRDHAFDAFENAKMKLAEWDVFVKGMKGELGMHP